MIALAQDCLVFKAANGQCIPFSADMVCVEFAGDIAKHFDPEAVRQACHAVFHYFKKELGRDTLTMEEFATMLEKALRGLLEARQGASCVGSATGLVADFGACKAPLNSHEGQHQQLTAERWTEADLGAIAASSGKGCELFFFPTLRAELCRHLQERSPVIVFRGLRRCVKQLLGARRWSRRCGQMSDEIVQYLRQCFSECGGDRAHALVVE